MSHLISLEQAVDMTTLYRADRETILATSYKGQNILPFCETFDRDAFDILLAQTGCVGIRIYYGMVSSKKVHAVIVGVDSNDADIIFPETQLSKIVEESRRCPNDCPPASDLNS